MDSRHVLSTEVAERSIGKNCLTERQYSGRFKHRNLDMSKYINMSLIGDKGMRLGGQTRFRVFLGMAFEAERWNKQYLNYNSHVCLGSDVFAKRCSDVHTNTGAMNVRDTLFKAIGTIWFSGSTKLQFQRPCDMRTRG